MQSGVCSVACVSPDPRRVPGTEPGGNKYLLKQMNEEGFCCDKAQYPIVVEHDNGAKPKKMNMWSLAARREV